MGIIRSVGKIIENKGEKYEIKELINMGNFAYSYKAERISDGLVVFLKEYYFLASRDQDEIDKFIGMQEEIRKRLAPIKQAETIIDHFWSSELDSYFQVKEFLEGKDLYTYIEDEIDRVPIKDRIVLAAVIAYGMKLVHEAGIVHRDLKPQQIFLKVNEKLKLKYEIKISDFDFSSVNDMEPIISVVTPEYITPEAYKKEKITYKSDIFQLGTIFFKLLSGGLSPIKFNREFDNIEHIKPYIIDNIPRRLKLVDIISEIPEKISDLVYRMLEMQPELRPDISEVHKTLMEFTEEKIEEKLTPVAPSPSAPPVEKPGKSEVIGAPTRVLFKFKDEYFSIHKSSDVGRNNFRIFVNLSDTGCPPHKSVSPIQFHILKKEDGFYIRGAEEVKNPTLLNGEDITGKEVKLNNGDIIEIRSNERPDCIAKVVVELQ